MKIPTRATPRRCVMSTTHSYQIKVFLRAPINHDKVDLVLELLLDLPHAGGHNLAVLAP